MNRIVAYLGGFFLQSEKSALFFNILIISILIYINYYTSLDVFPGNDGSFYSRFLSLLVLFFPVFAGSWIAGLLMERQPLPRRPIFWILLAAAPAIYAVKMAAQPNNIFIINWLSEEWNDYFNIILQWPVKLVMVAACIGLLWKLGGHTGGLPGTNRGRGNIIPYLLLLLIALPVLFIMGGRPDFQQVYPKLQMVPYTSLPLSASLFFELCYGTDFFTVELFFRGFLVLVFTRYGGMRAILPMAVFYCTIHFGKPAAECISSFFGGIFLGAIVHHTRSIWSGLVIHLVLAWTMELVGWIYA